MVLIVGCFFMAGCATLDAIAPLQADGNRQPTEITKAVAGVVPFGDVALGFVLLVAAGYQKYKSAKLEKGLKATLMAGKKVANDPQLAEMWEKVKDAYRQEHENAGVTNLVKAMLAKLPSVVKSI
jgi:hypothetical protein